MDTSTHTFQRSLTIPKMSGERWVEGELQRQGVLKRFGVEKESRQVRTCPRVMGPSLEAHKGPPATCAMGRTVLWARQRRLHLWPLLLRMTMQYYQARQALCRAARQASLSTNKWETGTKRQLQKNMCAWSRKAAEDFQNSLQLCTGL